MLAPAATDEDQQSPPSTPPFDPAVINRLSRRIAAAAAAAAAEYAGHPWVRATDTATSRDYYFNCRTGQSQWRPPAALAAELRARRVRRTALDEWRRRAAAGRAGTPPPGAGQVGVVLASARAARGWARRAGTAPPSKPSKRSRPGRRPP